MDPKRDSRPEILCVVFSFTAIFALIAIDTVMAPAALAQTDSSIFLPAVTYTAGVMPTSVAVADVNGDGRPDLVVADTYGGSNGGNPAPGGVSVLMGNGDGTFQLPVTYNSGGVQASSVAVADVNNDGKPDVVVSNYYKDKDHFGIGSVSVLLGNGDGTFKPAVGYLSAGGYPAVSVAVADVNGDGKPDLLVTNDCPSTGNCLSGPGSVGVLLGNGDGTFQPSVIYPAGLQPQSLVVADFNWDGKRDLVVANHCTVSYPCNGGTVAVLLGRGDGTFRAATMYPAGYLPTSVAVGDVNSDGQLDLVVTNTCASLETCPSATVSVLLGNGDGTFRPRITYASGGYSNAVAVTDMNGDGVLDVVVADECGPCGVTNGVGVLLGNGDGTFQPVRMYSSGGGNVNAVALADLNGDGKPDAVAVHGNDSTVGVLLNNAPFCTTPPTVTLSATPTSLWPPNGRMVAVTASGTITDTGCSIRTASYAVKDEYGEVQPSGPVKLGPGGDFSFTVGLQAARRGNDLDGRSYKVIVRASTSAGNTGSKAVNLIVPHDQGTEKHPR